MDSGLGDEKLLKGPGEDGRRWMVSVIVPVHNGARYLAHAIESVIEQAYRPLEIIAVDDGSTDGSSGVIARFGDTVRYCYQENRGTGAARNRGVELARGGLLAFLDQDDLWEHGKLVLQVGTLASDPSVDAVFGMVAQFYSSELSEEFRSRVQCPAQALSGYLPSAMLLRRDAFLRVGRFEEHWKLVEWAEWLVRAIEAGINLRVLPQVVSRRRLHAGNKGLAMRAYRDEYPRILKARLDRRRATKEHGSS
jgi:glycosyltransferase involved in cell wall biosynthesis